MLKPNKLISPKKPTNRAFQRYVCRKDVVKFSHTNRKHFIVGDPMAFPIVKMENTPKKLPHSLHDVDPI